MAQSNRHKPLGRRARPFRRQLALVAGATLIVILLAWGATVVIDAPRPQPGARAPELALPDLDGRLHSLSEVGHRAVLLSFVSFHLPAEGSPPNASRGQVVFLKSMAQQYGSQGLTLRLVDSSGLATGAPLTADERINAVYNWSLANVPVLVDEPPNAAAAFAVEQPPATFLIASSGVITHRWDGFVSAQELASAVQRVLGSGS